MKKIYLPIFCMSFNLAFGQISQGDQAKIFSVVGKDFKVLPNRGAYPYSSSTNGAKFQPSLTKKGDTTGIIFNEEYVQFRHPINQLEEEEILKLMNPRFVTVKEYNEFHDYVRDSIAQSKIFLGLTNSAYDHQGRVFNYDGKNWPDQEESKEAAKVGTITEVGENRFVLALHRDYRFSYTDPLLMPFLADMYYPQNERLQKMRGIDERKLRYSYTDEYAGSVPVRHLVPVLSDTYVWSAGSAFDRDQLSVLGHLYNQNLPNEPVTGITGMQANAFCRWKQEQIQRALNAKHLPFKVVVTTPLREDLPEGDTPEMTIPARDFTQQWQITVGEYQKFIAAVQDSILREELFYAIPSESESVELLDFPKLFFDEGRLNFMSSPDLRKYDRTSYRFLLPLNYKYKVEKDQAEMSAKIKDSEKYKNPSFAYSYFDAKERSNVGKIRAKTAADYRHQEGWRDTTSLSVMEIGADGENIGKDLILDYDNELGQSYGVRSYENFHRLMHHRSIAVLPTSSIGNAEPKSLIRNISYEQAIAFYYWKYPLHKSKSTDEWQKFVVPSQEQFERVQNGGSVVVPEQKVLYPAPVFRYVVHVYPNQ